MEVLVVVIGLSLLAIGLIVKPANHGLWQMVKQKENRSNQSGELEESVFVVMQRRLLAKQEHHRAQTEQWEATFFGQLPASEHPDFLEPLVQDVKREVTTQSSPDGRIVSRTTSWWTPGDQAYTIRKTYQPVTYRISRGKYSEDITGKWLRLKQERKAQRRRPIGTQIEGEPRQRQRGAPAGLPEIPREELIRFYSPAEIADPLLLNADRFEMLVGSTEPGNCSGCGRFKKKISLGYYICRDVYFKGGQWRHRF